MADGLRAVVVGLAGGVVGAVDLARIQYAARVGVVRGRTFNMASLTRSDLMSPLRVRLSIKLSLEVPWLRHAMLAARTGAVRTRREMLGW